jgi:hypothetical protein
MELLQDPWWQLEKFTTVSVVREYHPRKYDGLYGLYRFHNVLTTTLTCRGGARCRRHVVLEAHSN